MSEQKLQSFQQQLCNHEGREASPNIIDAEANFWSFCCSEHKPFNYSGVFSKGRGIKSLERLRGHKNGRRSSEGQAFLITWPSP